MRGVGSFLIAVILFTFYLATLETGCRAGGGIHWNYDGTVHTFFMG